MHVRSLTDEEMPKEVLDVLAKRFEGREIPAAYRILARNPMLLMKFIEFRDEIIVNGKLDFKGKDCTKSFCSQ